MSSAINAGSLGDTENGIYPSQTAALEACENAPKSGTQIYNPPCIWSVSATHGEYAKWCTDEGGGNWICHHYHRIVPACVLPEVFDYGLQACAIPIPTDDGTCEVGTEKSFSNKQSSNPGDLAPSICGTDGCLYTLQPHMSFGLPSLGSATGSYIATSTTCNPGIEAPTEEQVLPGKQCAEDAYGNKICIEPAVTNCGEFNGKEFCAEDIPQDGECHLLGSGGFICDGATPPKNIDGTDQNKVADVTDGTNDAQIYDANGGADAQDTEAGTEDTGIDETGTPTGTDGMYDGEVDGTGIAGLLDGIGSEGTGGGVATGGNTISFSPNLPASATCQSITTSWAGKTIIFPGVDGCIKLGKWRDIMGWFFYILTALYIVNLATKRPV